MVSRYIRSNVLGFVAIFIALGGVGVAAGLAKNSVRSKQIKNGQVKSIDVADNGLTGTDIDESTLEGLPAGPKGETGVQGPPGANGSPDTAAQVLAKLLTVDGTASNLDADTLDGQSSAAFLGATATAGGDLTGNYPSPSIAGDAVSSAKVANNSLTGADVDESTLGTVPNATNAASATTATNASQFAGHLPSEFGAPVMLGRINDLGTGSTPNLMPSGLVTDVTVASSSIVPAAFVARDLRVALVGGPLAGGQTRTFTMVKFGAATALTCTIPAGGSSCQDTSDDVAYSPGNQIAIALSATGAPTATQDVQYGYAAAPG